MIPVLNNLPGPLNGSRLMVATTFTGQSFPLISASHQVELNFKALEPSKLSCNFWQSIHSTGSPNRHECTLYHSPPSLLICASEACGSPWTWVSLQVGYTGEDPLGSLMHPYSSIMQWNTSSRSGLSGIIQAVCCVKLLLECRVAHSIKWVSEDLQS